MIQDSAAIKIRHQKFIETVCKTQIIYGLNDGNGFATVPSNDYEDEDGEEAPLICFWSEAFMARVLAKEEWSAYKVEEIELASFLENWCLGMSNDSAYAGTNLDMNLFGSESDPIELALDLANEIKKNGYEVALRFYGNIDEYEADLKQILKDMEE